MVLRLFLFLFSLLPLSGWAQSQDIPVDLPSRLTQTKMLSSTVDVSVTANSLARFQSIGTSDKWKKHTHAIAASVLEMYRENGVSFVGWVPLPINIINGGAQKEAFYNSNPASKSINFSGNTHHDFDVVAHETGHSVLDFLKPEYDTVAVGAGQEHIRFQLDALHEAFADTTAIFLGLKISSERLDQGALHNLFAPKNAVAIATTYSGSPQGLRNPVLAHNQNYLQFVEDEDFHDFSQIVTCLTHRIIFELCSYKLRDSATGCATFGQEDFTKELRSLFLTAFTTIALDDPKILGKVGRRLVELTIDKYKGDHNFNGHKIRITSSFDIFIKNLKELGAGNSIGQFYQ